MLAPSRAIACAAVVGAILGCSGDAERAREEARATTTTSGTSASGTEPPVVEAPTSEAALGPGDVRIVTTNGGIDLALIGDSISSGLSPQAISKVREETDTAQVTGSGFGAQIEKMVKGTVQGAIGKRASFPLSEVRGVRYDGEKLVFEWVGEPRRIFEGTKIDGKPLLASFDPTDARRFAEAVNKRKGKPKNL
jgi:hypothetical protein